MKLCLIALQYDFIFSGPGAYCKNLIGGLKNTKHEITLIVPRVSEKTPAKEVDKNVTIHRIECYDFKNKSFHDIPYLKYLSLYRKGLKKFFSNKKNDFDLVHILDINHSFFLRKKLFPKSKVLISINDFYALITPYNYFKFTYPCTDKTIRFFYYHVLRRIHLHFLKKANYIFTNTKFCKDLLVKRFKFKKEKIYTVYRGVFQEKAFKPAKDKYTNHQILFVGGNAERKGLFYVIKSMPAIVKAYDDANLTVVGKLNSKAKEEIQDFIKEHNLQNNITLIDHLGHEDVLKLHRQSNVFVLASIIENLAQTLLESMSAGTPTIATKVNANPEAVSNSEGILIPPKSSKAISDAVKEIFNNPKEAEKKGKQAFKKIQDQFTINKMVKETLNAYEDMVKRA